MIAAIQRDEFGAWNSRSDFLPDRERHAHVARAVRDQGRGLHLWQKVGDIDGGHLDHESLHHLRGCGDAFQVVEPARLLGCPSRDELRGEPLPVGVMLAAPARADQRSIELDKLPLLIGIVAMEKTARVSAVDDQMRHPLGVARGIFYGDCAALRHAQQNEALERKAIDDTCEVVDPSIERNLDGVPLGQAGAAPVVTNERMPAGHPENNKMPPHRAIEFVLQVREPV